MRKQQEPVILVDTFKPEYSGDKLFYLPLDTTPAINKRYYLSDYPEVDDMKVIGIEFLPSGIIQPVVINGITYQIISQAEAKFVQVSLYDKDNEPILYRSPLTSFNKIATTANNEILELRDYNEIKIYTGKSYLEFIDTAFITPFPMAIPLRFIF